MMSNCLTFFKYLHYTIFTSHYFTILLTEAKFFVSSERKIESVQEFKLAVSSFQQT